MPDLSERQVQVGGEMQISPPAVPTAHFPPMTPMQPVGTGFTRSPIPPIWASNPDSLRMWDRSGIVPQLRILAPALKGNS
jgi:hypothetical protein